MSNIKKIYCFGTSYTAGGGFEFQDLCHDDLYKIYSDVNEEKTQFNFSYPGQLKKLLKNNNHNIEVVNLAKSGFGNERIYRMIWDVITKTDFKKEETLFIIEWSDVGRKEFFYNELRDYIICNYDYNNGEYGEYHGISYKWNSKAFQKINTKLENKSDLFRKFINQTTNVVEQIKLAVRNTHNAMGFLEYHGVNMIHTQPVTCWGPPDFIQENYTKYQLFDEAAYGILQWLGDSNETIKKETRGVINDYHAGIVGSKKIAIMLYNKMIDNKFIDGHKTSLVNDELYELKKLIYTNSKIIQDAV